MKQEEAKKEEKATEGKMGKTVNKYFPKHLYGRYLGGGQWKLTKSFEYHSKKYGVTKVPVGFVTDGASIPRLAQSIIGSPWGGKYGRPALIHDYLYSIKHNRKEADLIFLEAMKICGVPFWKRKVMYLSLRAFGWIPY